MTVAIIWHRKIDKTPELVKKVNDVLISLIENKNADTFIFGSRSEFDDLCYKIITKIKINYPHIKRIYAMAEYDNGGEDYRNYLLSYYEYVFYDDSIRGAGVLSYVKRNQLMVNMCDVLVVYYNLKYKPARSNSGTKLAVEYARQRNKFVINVFK